MIICNNFCSYCDRKGYKECWREICSACGGYVFLHGDTKEQIEKLTTEHHHCKPLGIYPELRRRKSHWPQDVATV